MGEQLLSLAHQTHDSALLLEAHHTLWATLVSSGELSLPEPTWSRGSPSMMPRSTARMRCSMADTTPGMLLLPCGVDPVDAQLSRPGAAEHARGAHTRPRAGSPPSLAMALRWMATLQQSRQEKHAAREGAEACAALAGEQGFAPESAQAMILQGWAFVERGRGTEEIVQQQGLAAFRATGSVLRQSYYLALLAEAYGKWGRSRKG